MTEATGSRRDNLTADIGSQTAPVLETERLRLRPFRHEDLAVHAEILSDPIVMRYLGATPHSREESWRRMLCAPGLWALLGYGYWAVERRDDQLMIGQIGFADFKRGLDPCIEGIPEMGWIFASHVHGQGYAFEAAQAAISWIDASGLGDEVTAIIDPENAASIRLAERIGFADKTTATYRGEPILLLRRRR